MIGHNAEGVLSQLTVTMKRPHRSFQPGLLLIPAEYWNLHPRQKQDRDAYKIPSQPCLSQSALPIIWLLSNSQFCLVHLRHLQLTLDFLQSEYLILTNTRTCIHDSLNSSYVLTCKELEYMPVLRRSCISVCTYNFALFNFVHRASNKASARLTCPVGMAPHARHAVDVVLCSYPAPDVRCRAIELKRPSLHQEITRDEVFLAVTRKARKPHGLEYLMISKQH
jgi:hypothetical protein